MKWFKKKTREKELDKEKQTNNVILDMLKEADRIYERMYNEALQRYIQEVNEISKEAELIANYDLGPIPNIKKIMKEE